MSYFKYKGYSYEYEDDYEEDNVKRFHTCVHPDGSRHLMAFSPYARVSAEVFKAWIDMERPGYGEFGPGNLRPEDVLPNT